MIGENATRKGERAKKVPKYMQYDVTHLSTRTQTTAFTRPPRHTNRRYIPHAQRKDRPMQQKWHKSQDSFKSFSPTSTRVRLSHAELRDYHQHNRPDPSLNNHQHLIQHRPPTSHPPDNNTQKAQGGTQPVAKRPKEGDQRGGKN